MLDIKRQKTLNKHRRKSIHYLAIFLGLTLSSLDAFTYWHDDQCDQICSGYWLTHLPPHDHWMGNSLLIEILHQEIDLKTRILNAEVINAMGYGLLLKADKMQAHFSSHSHDWILKDNVQLQTKHFFLSSERLEFKEAERLIQGENVNFIMLPYHIYGFAQKVTSTPKRADFQNVRYTQCPPGRNDWMLSASSLSLDIDEDKLTIADPSVWVYGRKLFSIPSLTFVKQKLVSKYAALPRLGFSQEGSFRLKFPILLNGKAIQGLLTPEYSIKYGFGQSLKISNNSHEFHEFSTLPVRSQDHNNFAIGLIGSENTENVRLDYQAQIISDPSFVYRYPDMVNHYRKLYSPSYFNLKFNTSVGMLEVYHEKLYRYQEAIDTLETIETPLDLRLVNRHPFLDYEFIFQKLYRYDDKSYERHYAHLKPHLPYFDLETTAVSYAGLTDQYRLNLRIPLFTQQFYALPCEYSGLWFGEYTDVVDDSPLLDVVALPLTFESLSYMRPHQGEDWVAKQSWWQHQLYINHSSSDLSLHFLINQLLHQGAKNWIPQNTHPFFFRGQQNWSPLGMKLSWGEQLVFRGLIDLHHVNLFNMELDYRFHKDDIAGYVSLFHHDEFPIDRLAQVIESITYLNLGFQSKNSLPKQYSLETKIDLKSIKVTSAHFGLNHDHCCWSSGIKIGFDQEYSPADQEMKTKLSFACEAKINTLGFWQLGKKNRLQFQSKDPSARMSIDKRYSPVY